MKKVYDWKNHYTDIMTKTEESDNGFTHFKMSDKTGTGKIIHSDVFEGIQAVYNELNLENCRRTVPPLDDVIQINFCMAGRYECRISDRYFFYVSHGDLSVGTVGRPETHGSLPTRHFCGISLYIETEKVKELQPWLESETGIDLKAVLALAVSRPRYFIIRDNARFNELFSVMIKCQKEHCLPLLKIKTLELLALLSRTETAVLATEPVYISPKHVLLAKKLQERITDDLAEHLTIGQLAEEFQAAPTTVKTAFRSVYGISIGGYRKIYRLQEAQKLLRESDLPISEVAAKVGYTNPGKFSSVFKETFSVTPGEYKKSARLHFE
ncbi:MAG: helix-turn-helix transcriptional regulator [Firmicutes bacterium]|nr:helix-turn-helix transcriptional regulator [Bacillota bacterium]